MDPNKNEQDTTPADATPRNDGWTQFGKTPPRTGEYAMGRGADQSAGDAGPQPTLIHPVPEPLAAPVPAQRARLTTGQKVGAGLALAAMAVGGGVVGALAATSFGGSGTTLASSAGPVVNPVGNVTTVADVAKAVQPAVVSIQIKTSAGGGEGSGVVLSTDGLILTNNHVVEAGGLGQGAQVSVKFSDGKSVGAKVVGTDPVTDLAVIRADDVSGLTAASIGDSDRLKVGDSVLAIGSPLGLSGSVTAGIVSALNRTVTVGGEQQQQLPPGWGGGQQQQSGSAPTAIGGAIQTDAAINPGNSGGALVNASGQVIGINTAIATNGGEGNIGVGFAIPINTAKQVAQQLIEKGKVTHAFLGVSLASAAEGTSGALVSEVTAGSPAAQAGIKQGDLITKINDTVVDDGTTVVGAVRGFKPGQKVTVTYVRDGRPQTATVTLAEKTGE
ncbi:putative serine protease PepD [Streptosporangium album]|uniref:Putative serine protease PepD n=1 Tax=Streptosporangium album TaxID=47479 RepID=A0A7W7WEB1_9ACTN|nr:trypsin-like peptidase domain-containing protein [Streptosporangium album]MBB4943708.1 putative serine protease PepD [Streptosporangium album]